MNTTSNQTTEVELLDNITQYEIPAGLLLEHRNQIQRGWNVLKVTKSGSLDGRHIGFSSDRRKLYISSNKKKRGGLLDIVSNNTYNGVADIYLHWIDRMVVGNHSSRRFLKLEQHADNATNQKNQQYEHCCCTIFYKSAEKFETLDMVFGTVQQFELFYKTLADLVKLAHQELDEYEPDVQYLHYHWMCLHLDWEQPISLPHFLQLNDNLQTNMKRTQLTDIFKEFDSETITFHQVAQLLPILKRHDPVLKIWNELVDTDPVQDDARDSISAIALLSFVRSTQRRYHTSLEEVHTFVQQLSGIPNADRLSKARFITWITSDLNDVLETSKRDSMNEPLSKYWIQTSTRYYNLHSIAQQLQRGVRCLELVLELPQQPQGEAVPRASSQPILVTNCIKQAGIPLRGVLRAVRTYLQEHPLSYPVLLKLENHLPLQGSILLANLLVEILGPNLLLQPHNEQLLHANAAPLPSPEAARGRVWIMAKRPRRSNPSGLCSVVMDDYDHDKKQFNADHLMQLQDEDGDNVLGAVIGFDTQGPIRSKKTESSSSVLQRTPDELWMVAQAELERALLEQQEADTLQRELLEQVDRHEVLTAQLTQSAGMSPEDVKKRAARAVSAEQLQEEEKKKEEGFEVHEILPKFVDANRDGYAVAAQASIEAAEVLEECRVELTDAEKNLENARKDLEMSQTLECKRADEAKRAASDARLHQEHAKEANERVAQVKELLKNSKEHASSAGTVVQTALTEAKISQKRAQDAESRWRKAKEAADRDRTRADEETKLEEELEQEVGDLHRTCEEATEAVQESKQLLEKANASLSRLNQQLKLIEKSSHYRDELAEQQRRQQQEMTSGMDHSPVRHGGSFLWKHEVKIEERRQCSDTIRQTLAEKSASETRVQMLRGKFDEMTRAWRTQANIATQARRSADKSSHIADELLEQAEEEREAAQLRQIAREKAVATVEDRGSQRDSVEAQLAEAERAAIEAAEVAAQSRARAEKLQVEAEKMKNHEVFTNAVAKRELHLQQAQELYNKALTEKEEKDRIAEEEKQRLDTTSAVYQSAAQDAATEGDRIKVLQLLEQEAIVAFNTTVVLRKQAESAVAKAEIAASVADAKKAAAEHAREFKEKRDLLVDIPTKLAKCTLLHTSRFLDWRRSFEAPSIWGHSFEYDMVAELSKTDTADSLGLRTVTEDHLIRVFPTPRDPVASKSGLNVNPVVPWSMGCQLVSMNFESFDENVMVADGRFRQNNSCGYALKPNPKAIEHPQTWSFAILSGYNLPKVGRRSIKPLVRVSLYTEDLESPTSFKTKCAEANGLCPTWSKDNFFTFTVEKPSLAVIVISVWDRQDGKLDSFVAGSSLPLIHVREGYRSLSLLNSGNARTGPFQYASLLIKSTKR